MNSEESEFFPAKTAKEQLRRWDAGLIVWSITMGGLGPGYEQGIQILAIEIVRDNLDSPLPNDESWGTWGDPTISRVDQRLPDSSYACGGFTGAQVGAAKSLAYHWLKDGPKVVCEMAKDRRIQVSRFWPRVPEGK